MRHLWVSSFFPQPACAIILFGNRKSGPVQGAGGMDMTIADGASGRTDTPRYAAFISYSHADEVAASKLHRKLEAYKLPANVRGDLGTPRLGSIFRDRADFAAASSLTTAIRSALAQSAALVVLCSPEAKQSQWVDGEIRLFRELHPNAPILSVILRGDPAEGMPDALTEDGREPLAADFRKDADGPKLGFLKVVAALKGVPLDSLIQRDAQRRLRRVIGITAFAFLLVIAMGAMTAFAISAQREAERQRAEAEGLIDYMMTELRTRLRGVGSGAVQRAVSERAMDYYRGQGDLSALPPDSLRQRALILQAMGEDEAGRGDVDEAMERFVEAHRTTSALLALDPNDPDRLYAHAQSEYWVGNILQLREDYPSARRRFDAYRRLAGRLSLVDGDRNRADREIGFAEGILCSIEIIDKGTDRPATHHCVASLASMQQVARRRPADPAAELALANRYGWVGMAMREDGDPTSGIDRLRESNRMVTDLLRRDPGNADYMDMLAGNLVLLARWQIEARQTADATATLDRSGQLMATLVRRDPERERWKFLLDEVEELRRLNRPTTLN